ncbi:hypothetical protein INT45_003766 [Circinella minor]|uniref:Uncharacterized protein n=1 Tax=Circinella minor TaxID=1195481 RepID=A0A8H7SAJ4_9FUNG|nr:hypothetical protein INT45_003766 [Circinella minor]
MRPKGDEHDNKTVVSFSYKPNPSRRFTPSASPSSATPNNHVVGPSTIESLSNNNNSEREGAAVSGSESLSWRTNNNGDNISSNLSSAKMNKSNDTTIISNDDDNNNKNDNNNNNNNNNSMVVDPASFISSLFKKTNNSNRSSTTSTVKIKKEYGGIVNPMTSVLETKQPYQQQQRMMKSDASRINTKRQPLPLIPSYNEQQQIHRKKEEPPFTVPIRKHHQLSEPSSSTASNHHYDESLSSSLSSSPQAPKTHHAAPTPIFTNMHKSSIDSNSSDDKSQKQKHIQLPLDSHRHQQRTPPSSRSMTSFPLTPSYFLPPTSLENLNKSVEEQPPSHSSISAPYTETKHDRNNNREQQQGQLIPTSPPEDLSTSSFYSIIPPLSMKKESQNVILETSSNNDRNRDDYRNYEEINNNNDGVAASDNNNHSLPEKAPYLIHNNRLSSVFQTRSSTGVFADNDNEEENDQVLLSQQKQKFVVMERNVRDTTFTNKSFYNNKPPTTISLNSGKSHTASVYQQQSRSAPSSQHSSFLLQPQQQKQQINTTSITQIDEIEQLAHVCKEKLVEQVQKYNHVTNEMRVLQTTIDSQQQCINQKERQATELTNWVEIMLSRQHRFDTSVTSLRGRYEAFSSVMSDLEKFANTCNETKIANTKTFEVFERRYCNQLLKQFSHLKGHYTVLDAIVSKLRSEHEELKSSILSLTEEYETERAKDYGELQGVENQEKYANVIQSLQNNVQEMTLELSIQTTESTQLKENINTTHETCIGLKSELSKIQATYEMELEKLRQEKSYLMDHNSALAEELKQEKERHQSLESRLNSESSSTSIVTTNDDINSQSSLRQHQETTTTTTTTTTPPKRPLASSSKNGVEEPVKETTLARVNLSNTEQSVPVSNTRGGNLKMTLRSISNQSYKIKAEEDLPQEEPLRKRRKRLPADKLISVDSDDDVEKEMQALIAASDPYKYKN